MHTVYSRSRVNTKSSLSMNRMYTSKAMENTNKNGKAEAETNPQAVKMNFDWPKPRNTQKLKSLELRVKKLESKWDERRKAEAEAEVWSKATAGAAGVLLIFSILTILRLLR